jgi:hypothetical protein
VSWPLGTEGVVVYTGALFAWALGLFVVSRGGLRLIPLLTVGATLVLVVYQLGQALGLLAPNASGWLAWSRATWWAAGAAPAVWLLLVLALAAQEAPEGMRTRVSRLVWLAAPVAAVVGLFFAVVGSTTNLVVDWLDPNSGQAPPQVPPGPLYAAYQAYVLVAPAAAIGVVALLWRSTLPGTPLRARFRWLLIAGVAFLLGGAYITTASRHFGYSVLPGQVLLSLGVITMAWNLARYGALLAGETVLADLLGFGAATAAVVALYGLVLLFVVPRDDAWLERLLPLLLLLMASHVAADRQNVVLDRLVFGATATTLRGRLRQLADRVVRQPDPVTALADVNESVSDLVREHTATNLRLLVEGAVRRANDLPGLSQHPLLDRLVPASEGTALERATRLRWELEAAIARLRPSGPRPTPGSHAGPGGWLHYLVLYEAYVEDRPNKQIMQRWLISESTFHRARRRALDAVADDLHERLARVAVS